MAQKGAKLLSKRVSRRSRRIALAELINEQRLVLCPLLGTTNDHESGSSSRGSVLQRDRLLGDEFGPQRAKAGHKQFNRRQRPPISPPRRSLDTRLEPSGTPGSISWSGQAGRDR